MGLSNTILGKTETRLPHARRAGARGARSGLPLTVGQAASGRVSESMVSLVTLQDDWEDI